MAALGSFPAACFTTKPAAPGCAERLPGQEDRSSVDTDSARCYGRTLTARAATMTSVKSEIVLSSIISIFARRVSGNTSVGLNAVAELNPSDR